VFWLPAAEGLYSEEELPQHPMLQLLANSEQHLSTKYTRRMITMAKSRPYDAAVAAAFKKQREGFVMALDKIPELVYPNRAGTPPPAGAGAAASGSADGQEAATAAGQQQQRLRGPAQGSTRKYMGKLI
jgi:tRNA (guanine10-N2)-methyltransferase